MINKYTGSYTVTLYDAGPGGVIKIPSLFNYFQGVTAEHANAIGFAGEDILRRGYHWVISRYRLSIERLPEVNDRFNITTWRSGEKGHFAIREFLLTGGDGTVLLRATSSWILLDISKMLPVVPSEMMPGYPINPVRALDDKFLSVPEVSSSDYSKEFSVRRSDLDMNTHVNNSVYASWLVETGEDMNEGKSLKDLTINFKLETRYGERVVSVAERDSSGSRIIHKLVSRESGIELTRGITGWS